MPSTAIFDASAARKQARPDIRPGFTVAVSERIQEGGKERTQVFEGLVISVHKGSTPADTTFTVRRIASGVGVEKVFALHSPKIEKIDVKKVARVRRAKLFFLRGRRGKSARLSERFTTADEFAVAAAPEPEVEEASEVASKEASSDAEEGTGETEKADTETTVKEKEGDAKEGKDGEVDAKADTSDDKDAKGAETDAAEKDAGEAKADADAATEEPKEESSEEAKKDAEPESDEKKPEEEGSEEKK